MKISIIQKSWKITRPNQVLFWCYVIIITTLISATLGAIAALLVPRQFIAIMEPAPKERSPLVQLSYPFQYRLIRPMHLLIMGVDQVAHTEFGGHSDTLLLLRIDPKTQTVNLLSLPRDTQVTVPQLGIYKLNEVNFLGSPEITIRTISGLLNGIEIDRYLRIKPGGLTELVNLIGGLEVYIETPMAYLDYTQGLRIELLPGWQTLNGKEAEDFVRFRGDALGDIGRIQRQQWLIKALQQQLKSPAVFAQIPRLLRKIEPYIDTNLTVEELIALVQLALPMESKNLRMVMLPGRSSFPGEYDTSYWLIDPDGRDRILREYFHQFWMGDAWNIPDYSVSTGRDPTTLRIALQNATNQPDLPEKVAHYLEQKGYQDVYFIPDSPHILRTTQIVVQKGDIRGAKILLDKLELGDLEMMSTGDLQSDITLRLGQDWLFKFSANP